MAIGRDRTEVLARRARQLRNVRHKEDAPTTSSRARLPDLSGGVYACAGLSRVFRLSSGLLMWDVSRRRLHFGNWWRAGAGRRSALGAGERQRGLGAPRGVTHGGRT